MMPRLFFLLLALVPVLLAQKKILMVATPGQDWAWGEAAQAEYRQAAHGATIKVLKADEIAGDIADADAIIGGLTQQQHGAARRLKWVQTYSAGVEMLRWPDFIKSDIVLTNCKIVQGPTIADHGLGMLLALARGLHRYIPNRTKEEWDRTTGAGLVDLGGMTAVVIGMGGIGSSVAQRAHAFGMRVIGVDPKDISLQSYIHKMVYPDELNSVLPEADVVFVAAPHTPESEGMMGARQFELMKPNSYFIALSRGHLYDTNALVRALDSRKLAGAGLDVTNPEPLPKGHPLWKFDNVIITPHVASQAPNSRARRVALIKENIRRFTSGERMLNIVDKVKGY